MSHAAPDQRISQQKRGAPDVPDSTRTVTILTSFERRQRLLDLVRKQSGLRVTEIAQALGVSEGTVRNDMNALADSGQLTRVWGGAVAAGEADCGNPTFTSRAAVNQVAKQVIARRAAELIRDGDTLWLDSSTTVYHLAGYILERQGLKVVTNGIETARILARNVTNSVILLGGLMRTDGASVIGPLAEQILRDIHIQTAFVSCSGFAPEVGLTEVDIYEAQLKSRSIQSAAEVVALVDSSKIGKLDLTPFIRPEQISHLFTDDKISPAWEENLRRSQIKHTICSEAV